MAETPYLNFFGGEFDPESGRFRDSQGRFVPAPPKNGGSESASSKDAESKMKDDQAAADVKDIKENTEDAAQALFDFAKEREKDKQKQKRDKVKEKGGLGKGGPAGETDPNKSFIKLFGEEIFGDITGFIQGIISTIPLADQAQRAFKKFRKQRAERKRAEGVGGGGGVESDDSPIEDSPIDSPIEDSPPDESGGVGGNFVEVVLELRNSNAFLYSINGVIVEMDRKFAELLAHMKGDPLEDVEAEREARRAGKVPSIETPDLDDATFGEGKDGEGGILGDILGGGVAGIVSRFLPAVVTAMAGSTILAGLATIAAALLGTAVVGLAIRGLINAISDQMAEQSQRERDTQTVESKPVTNEAGEEMFTVTKDGEEMVVPKSKLTTNNFTQEELDSARPVSQTVDPDTGQPLAGPSTIEEGPMPDALAETPMSEGGSANQQPGEKYGDGGILANLSRMEFDIMQNTLSHLRGDIDDKTAGNSLLHLYKQYRDLLERQSDEFKDKYPDIYSGKNMFFKQARALRGSRGHGQSFRRTGSGDFRQNGHFIHRAILDGKSDRINTSGAAAEMGRKLIQASEQSFIRPKERSREKTISVPVEMSPTFRDQNLERSPDIQPSPPASAALEPNVSDTVAGAAVLAGAEFENASAARGSGSGVMGGILSQEIDASSSLTNQTFVDASGTETHTSSAPFRDAANMNRGTMYS